jgi:hypothetical protein
MNAHQSAVSVSDIGRDHNIDTSMPPTRAHYACELVHSFDLENSVYRGMDVCLDGLIVSLVVDRSINRFMQIFITFSTAAIEN